MDFWDGVVLFNFGDSNSDTGGVAAVMGIRIAPPEGRAYFHHPTGRLSDGRVILDFICECSLLQSPISLLFLLPIPPLSCAPGRCVRTFLCLLYQKKKNPNILLAAPDLGVTAGQGGLVAGKF